jgi:hypothetical protein
MSEDCLAILDQWIMSQKNIIYDENIKGPNNKGDVISNYTMTLSKISNNLKTAIRGRDKATLLSFGWTNDLIECINDANMRLEINDRITMWFETYPNVKSSNHLKTLIGEEYSELE